MFDKFRKLQKELDQVVLPPPYSIMSSNQDGDIILSTTGEIPGFKIDKNHGVVFGTTVRRGKNFSMMLTDEGKKDGEEGKRGLTSSELYMQTSLVQVTFEEAVERMIAGVKATGANAACGIRFDSEYIGHTNISQVCCCATAVSVVPKGRK